jgi:hypothetical protein
MSLSAIFSDDVTIVGGTAAVTVTRYDDGDIEFTDAQGNKVVASSNTELAAFLDALVAAAA